MKAMKALPDIELLPEEADKFIDYIVDQSFWKNNARIVKMEKVEKNLRYLGFKAGTRFLKPAANFASSDYLKQFAHGKVTLHAQKVRGAVVIYDDDLEEGIEGQAFADHLMKIIAKKVANEIDEAAYCSHEGFAETDIRSLWKGFRHRLLAGQVIEKGVFPKAATILDASLTLAGHDADFAEAGKIAEKIGETTDWEFKFAKMLAVMPSKYKLVGLKNLRFFCNDIIPNDYAEALANRATILGDKALLGETDLPYRTVPIASVPLMPITYEVVEGTLNGQEDYELTGTLHDIIAVTASTFDIAGDFTAEFPAGLKIIVSGSTKNDGIYTVVSVAYADTTTTITVSETVDTTTADGRLGGNVCGDVILTPKNNFIIGIQKELTLESKRAPEDQAQYVFYNLKIDIAVENPEAAVILVNVTHG
ncbi:hypothetical protein ES708_06567 [subsurface metagenome]